MILSVKRPARLYVIYKYAKQRRTEVFNRTEEIKKSRRGPEASAGIDLIYFKYLILYFSFFLFRRLLPDYAFKP